MTNLTNDLYVIIDIFSRYVVGWTVAPLEEAYDAKIPEPPDDLPMATVAQAFDYVCSTLAI